MLNVVPSRVSGAIFYSYFAHATKCGSLSKLGGDRILPKPKFTYTVPMAHRNSMRFYLYSLALPIMRSVRAGVVL